MRTKRYWANRYTDFIEKVLKNEINYYRNYAGELKQEIEGTFAYFEGLINENKDEWESSILFLYTNHRLNSADPIGFCYPGHPYEYDSYAWEMVDSYIHGEKEEVMEKLKGMWLSTASDPERDIKIIVQIWDRIIKQLDELYLELNREKDTAGDRFDEKQYWQRQYYAFHQKVLLPEIMEYAYKANSLRNEADQLLKDKENNLLADAEEYVKRLYINHQVNLLDPTKIHYPGSPHQYDKYAQLIYKAYYLKDGSDCYVAIKNCIDDMYASMGYDPENYKQQINNGISEIQAQLAHLDK